jgi:hypothetical protein
MRRRGAAGRCVAVNVATTAVRLLRCGLRGNKAVLLRGYGAAGMWRCEIRGRRCVQVRRPHGRHVTVFVMWSSLFGHIGTGLCVIAHRSRHRRRRTHRQI